MSHWYEASYGRFEEIFFMFSSLPKHLTYPPDCFSVSKKQLTASHQRSIRYHVDPKANILGDILTGTHLQIFLEQYEDVIPKARALFSKLIEVVQDKICAFILTDPEGRIIEIFSSSEIILECAKCGAHQGGSLAEKSCGTNAVSLALYSRKPVVLKGDDHFSYIFKDWQCIAVPIMDSDNQPIGCIDLSTGCMANVHEKLALLQMVSKDLSAMMGEDAIEDAPIYTAIDLPALSERQNQIVKMLCKGKTCKEIARSLKITPSTVETHLTQMKKKYNVVTTYQLIGALSGLNTTFTSKTPIKSKK